MTVTNVESTEHRGEADSRDPPRLDTAAASRSAPGGPKAPVGCAAAAALAIVATARDVCREPAATPRAGVVQRTRPGPLHARSFRGPEAEQVRDLHHGDLIAKSIEVNTGHASCSRQQKNPRALTRDRENAPLQVRSVPFLTMGNGNAPRRKISPSSRRVADRRACGGAGQFAPATPARRPGARSGPKGNREAWHASAPRRGPEDQRLAP